MAKLTLYIILILSFSLTSYGKDDEITIATVQLDKTLKEDNDLRISLLNTIKEYSFLKQMHLIKVDRKIKKLYKNKKMLSIEDALNVSKELKLDVAILIHKEKRLVEVTNDMATNTNTTIINNMETNINSTATTNETPIKKELTNRTLMNITNATNSTVTNNSIVTPTTNMIMPLATNNTIENLTTNMVRNSIGTNLSNNKHILTNIYFVQGIDVETGKSFYSNEAKSVSDVSTLTREVLDIIGINYSKNMLDKIEKPSNDINLEFSVNIINDDNTKTALTNNADIYVSDKLEFNFTVNKNGFVTILGFLSNDSMLIISPNDFNKITNVSSNESYSIPSEDSIFNIVTSGLNGADEYYIIFTEDVPDWITDTTYLNGTGFKSINQSNMPKYSKLILDELKKEKNWTMQKIKLNLNEFILIRKSEMSEDSVYRRYY